MKENLHPNSYLHRVKNVAKGLKARTSILTILEVQSTDATKISKETSLSYRVVMHHLKLLENEGVVQHKGKHHYVWLPSGFGQKRLS